MKTRCPTWKALLAWQEHDLGSANQREVLEHVNRCGRCRDRLRFEALVAEALGEDEDDSARRKHPRR